MSGGERRIHIMREMEGTAEWRGRERMKYEQGGEGGMLVKRGDDIKGIMRQRAN